MILNQANYLNCSTLNINMCSWRILLNGNITQNSSSLGNSMNLFTLKLCRPWKKILARISPHFNARFNYIKFEIEYDEDLYDFSTVVNFHYDKFSFVTLTEQEFDVLVTAQTSNLAMFTTRNSSCRKTPAWNCKKWSEKELRVWISAPINSDGIFTRLVHKMSASMTWSTQFVAQPNMYAEKKPSSLCSCCRGWHFPQRCPFKKYRCKQCEWLNIKRASPRIPKSSIISMTKTNRG